MVQNDDVMKLLVNVCPSFEDEWKVYLQSNKNKDNDFIIYKYFSKFAKHLSELVMIDDLGEFNNIFGKIEFLLENSEPFIQEAVVVGLLEDFQSNLEANNYEISKMEKFMGSETMKYWRRFIKYKNGEIVHINKIGL